MKLEEIEKAYGFTYPSLYKKLETDGMLEIGEYGPSWYQKVFPLIRDRPTLLLHSADFELLNVKAVLEAIEDLKDPDNYRQIDSQYQFVPFGQSGAGDHYCFFLTEQKGDDIPIVFLWHDSNEVNYLAKNMQDYIFKKILTDMANQDIYNEVSDDEFRTALEATLKTHARYLPAEQSEILQEMLKRPVTDYEIPLLNGRMDAHRGLLTNTEVDQICARMIPFDKMGETFPYSQE